MDEFRIAVAVMGRNMDKLPVHPDKILFAEDLVNYINDFYGIYHRLDRAERFREITYNAFNETVKTGVNYIQSECSFPSTLDSITTWDENTYFHFAGQLKEHLFYEGLEPVKFLYFCVDVTHLAGVFLLNGLSNAPQLAVIVIYVTLIRYDMLLGGWDSVNFAAKKLKEEIDLRDIMMSPTTPDTSSVDTSDDELRQRISGSSSPDEFSDDELLGTDTDDNISSDGNEDEFKLHVAGSENTSAFNTERFGGNLQLRNVRIENQHIEPIHDFTNYVRERGEVVTQQEDAKANMNINEELEDENIPQSCAIPNGRQLQHA